MNAENNRQRAMEISVPIAPLWFNLIGRDWDSREKAQKTQKMKPQRRDERGGNAERRNENRGWRIEARKPQRGDLAATMEIFFVFAPLSQWQ